MLNIFYFSHVKEIMESSLTYVNKFSWITQLQFLTKTIIQTSCQLLFLTFQNSYERKINFSLKSVIVITLIYGCWIVAKRIFVWYQNVFLFNQNKVVSNQINLYDIKIYFCSIKINYYSIKYIYFHSTKVNLHSKKIFFNYINFFHPIKFFLLYEFFIRYFSNDHIWSFIFICKSQNFTFKI